MLENVNVTEYECGDLVIGDNCAARLVIDVSIASFVAHKVYINIYYIWAIYIYLYIYISCN